MIATLIVLAKEPLPGRVKTRLVPPLTHEEAAALAVAALADTIAAVSSAPAAGRMLAFDGPADNWVPADWTTSLQPCGGLDRRMAAAFTASVAEPALLVGMDTPQLRRDDLTQWDPSRFDACLGRSPDGGYWAIGLREPHLAALAIHGVPMSRTDTADVQLARLRALGLRVQLLNDRLDVDTYADAREVSVLAPHTRFAATFDRITNSHVRAG